MYRAVAHCRIADRPDPVTVFTESFREPEVAGAVLDALVKMPRFTGGHLESRILSADVPPKGFWVVYEPPETDRGPTADPTSRLTLARWLERKKLTSTTLESGCVVVPDTGPVGYAADPDIYHLDDYHVSSRQAGSFYLVPKYDAATLAVMEAEWEERTERLNR